MQQISAAAMGQLRPTPAIFPVQVHIDPCWRIRSKGIRDSTCQNHQSRPFLGPIHPHLPHHRLPSASLYLSPTSPAPALDFPASASICLCTSASGKTPTSSHAARKHSVTKCFTRLLQHNVPVEYSKTNKQTKKQLCCDNLPQHLMEKKLLQKGVVL